MPSSTLQKAILQMNDVMQGHLTLLHVIRLVVWQKHVISLSLKTKVFFSVHGTASKSQQVYSDGLLHSVVSMQLDASEGLVVTRAQRTSCHPQASDIAVHGASKLINRKFSKV